MRAENGSQRPSSRWSKKESLLEMLTSLGTKWYMSFAQRNTYQSLDVTRLRISFFSKPCSCHIHVQISRAFPVRFRSLTNDLAVLSDDLNCIFRKYESCCVSESSLCRICLCTLGIVNVTCLDHCFRLAPAAEPIPLCV